MSDFNPVISVTPDAVSQPNGRMTLAQIIEFTRTGWHRKKVAQVRKTFAEVLNLTGDPVKAKKAIDAEKKNLPGIMFSGSFKARGDKNLEEYSQILCGDVDGLTHETVGAVYDKIAMDEHCLSVSISPSGFGVKFLCRTTGTADQHKQSVAAMEKYFHEVHQVELDPACKNLERLCFAPDNATDLRLAAIPFEPLAAPAKKLAPARPAVIGTSRKDVAERLLGQIEWSDEFSGFCKCPGEHLHTSKTGPKDCLLRIDGAPTAKCFHASCSGIIAGVNLELRSLIGQAEAIRRTPPTAHSGDRNGSFHEYIPGEDEIADAEAARDGPLNPLPEIVDACAFLSMEIKPPDELISGILHKGSKLAFGGSSKSFKTWNLLDMAISVAAGARWIGRETVKGKVLFLNFEIQGYFWQHRIAVVSKAKGIELTPGMVNLWNLRGHAANFRQIIPKVIDRCRLENFSMIVLDPIYKLYGGADENAAGDMAELFNSLETVAVQTGAAIAYGAHFAKGNASQKEAIDRISGSGVFARDPDSLVIFTKHEEDDAFVIEPILRNLPPVDPFVVRWNFPLMEAADDLNPEKLKQAAGRKSENFPEDILALLPESGLTQSDWLKAAQEKGVSERTFFRLKSALKREGKTLESRISGKWVKISTQTGR